MRPYELIIDHDSCWGCRTCELACKQENRDPAGVRLIRVLEEGPEMTGGRPSFTFRVRVCRHCDEPACVEVCPEDAVSTRDDGIVVLDDEACSGCGLCADACPYDAIDLDPERGVAGKCNLCFHRVDNELMPPCADNVCPAHCVYFGDPEEIRREIARKHALRPRGPSSASG
ncbi:MAG: 4Fe-4S binding protein [Deltaproteobacteria bacterium]|nr:4Fe-4S binding protein [Deltaproteobacteria bacterium]